MIGTGTKKLYREPIAEPDKKGKEEEPKLELNTDKDKAAVAVRGGIFRNGVFYSESELSEQSNITWTPCYWNRERISKWVEEVEHPDTLKTIAKNLSISAPPSSTTQL